MVTFQLSYPRIRIYGAGDWGRTSELQIRHLMLYHVSIVQCQPNSMRQVEQIDSLSGCVNN